MALQRARRRRELSSASEHLAGFHFRPKAGDPLLEIRKIIKLGGAQRAIYVRGRAKPVVVDRATIHELAKLRGTLQYQRRLRDAPTVALRRHYLKVSRDRQRQLLLGHIGRLQEALKVAPAPVRRRIEAQIAHAKAFKFGSPLVGETPATSIIPPHHGPAKTFSVAARTGVSFRTIHRHGRTLVVPMGGTHAR